MTTTPNRYKTFNAKAISHQDKPNVSVERINVPSHNSGILDQIKSFYFYYREAIKITKNNEYDLIVATSSRLFTAFLRRKNLAKKKFHFI